MRSKSFKSPTVTQHLHYHPTKWIFISSSQFEPPFSTSLNMVRSIVAVCSVLSLLLYTHAATINVRAGSCYECPSEDRQGHAPTMSAFPACCYGDSVNSCCIYDAVSGFLLLHLRFRLTLRLRAWLTLGLISTENSFLVILSVAPVLQPK